MVFEHGDRPALDSFYFPYRCSRIECGRVQLDSVTGWEGEENADKDETHGGEKPITPSLESCLDSNGITGVSDKWSESPHVSFCGLPTTTSEKNGDNVRPDTKDGNVRPDAKHPRSSEEDIFKVAFKRARHANFLSHPHLDDCHDENQLKEPSILGSKPCSSSVDFFVGSKGLEVDESFMYENPTRDSSNGIPIISENTHTGCESVKRELPIQLSFDNNHPNNLLCPEDSLLLFCDRFPRRHVALGPDHQVDVPSWVSESFTVANDESNKRLMGTSVLNMHDNMAFPGNIGVGSFNDCNCIDRGSISCTRRHVAEARDRTRHTLGLESFAKLGFHDMGEDVAMHWTEEEEQLFQEVVSANPASLGKNFWNVLPRVLPSHSSRDLVSYYFNVFMLRKRAEQNRCDPWNVDSDNDEWQECSDGEFTVEDSGPGVYYQSPVDLQVSYVEEGEEEDDNEEDDTQEEDEDEGSEGPDGGSGIHACALHDLSCKSSSVFEESFQKLSQHSMEEQDAQDDSCTSYEGQHAVVDSCSNLFITTPSTNTAPDTPHKTFHEECRNNSSATCTPSSFGPKEWDVCYFSSSNKIDFLPTCYVIEEVFGKDSWDNESGEGHGI